MTSYSSRVLTIGLFLFAAAPTAFAIREHVPPELAPEARARIGEPPPLPALLDEQASKAFASTDPAFRAFAAETGHAWTARYDLRTARLSFAQGSSAPWLPAAHRVRSPEEVRATRELLAGLARDAMARHPGLLRVPAGVELALDERRSVPVGGGRVWQISFQPILRGVPVRHAFVTFRLAHGRLMQVGQQGLSDALVVLDTKPRLSEGDAARIADAHLRSLLGVVAEEAAPAREPALVIVPVIAADGLAQHLAWSLRVAIPGRIENWEMLVDARTGEPLFTWDANRYVCTQPAVPQGRVVGGVYLGPIETTPESLRGFPHAAVTNGGPVNADVNGVFPFTTGQPATTTLSGRYFDMNCDACNTPAQAFAQSTGPGDLTLGMGGLDETGNGLSTRAERNCFYHLNVVRQVADKHLDDAATGGFLSQNLDANVNIADACNAFYAGGGGGSVNFYQAGSLGPGFDCNNTGEIADVMQHEWGHGLDDNTGGIMDGDMSEGVGDVVAWLTTHDPRLGPYFRVGNPAGLRNADENVVPLKTWPTRDVDCPGPFQDPHCVGEIFSQAWWHLARTLRQRAAVIGGTDMAGWYLAERLFFEHLPLADTMDPAGANSMFDALLIVDDDDGIAATGVPDGIEIGDALGHHGLLSAAVTDSPDCTPLPAPAVTLSQAQDPATTDWQITIDWTDVASAAEYRVFRNESGGAGADVEIATVFPPGLQFRDDWVDDGVTYRYRVLALGANGCTSVVDNVQAITTAARLVLAVQSIGFDDAIGGNGNSAAEPGETIRFPVVIENTSAVNATGVIATMTSASPGVTVVQGTQNLGAIAAGATAATTSPHFEIQLDPSIACPGQIQLDLSLEATEGCSTAAHVVLIEPPPTFDTVESATGFTVNPGGTDTAGTGIWVHGVPNGTPAQVGADHTPGAGTRCFVTGNANTGGAGDDDVDGGCTTLRTPLYDLGLATGGVLSYWRAFSIGTAIDDVLLVEISNDDGRTWATLEQVAANTAGWEEATFDLDTVLGAPANLIRLRLTACDTGGGSLLEAAIDDIRFSNFPCTPPARRPLMSILSLTVGDSGVAGGTGNGDGLFDPGEVVRLPVEVRNDGSAPATAVAGTMTLVGAPAGVTVTDAAAPFADVAQGGGQEISAGAPPHFEITVDASVACGSTFDVVVEVAYDGPSETYTVQRTWSFMVGRIVDTLFHYDDFEALNGASHAVGVEGNLACASGPNCVDDWQRGQVTNTSMFDPPDSLIPGGSVWGNDLGAGADDGNYESECCNHLELAPIDCRGRTGVMLGFLRWLTKRGANFGEPGDQARILARKQSDTAFTLVWEPPVNDDFIDNQWVAVEHDISAIADGDPGVVIRFELETDGRSRRGGWNLDILRLFTRAPECAGAPCSNPPVPAAAGTVLFATGRKDDDGAEFEWPTLAAGPGEEYRLYRGTLPNAITTLVTPAGHATTSFDDRAAPGALYFYNLVLANCAGVEGAP